MRLHLTLLEEWLAACAGPFFINRKLFRLVLGCRQWSSTVDLIGFWCINGSWRSWAAGGDCAQMLRSLIRGLFRLALLRHSKLRLIDPP